MEKYDINDLSKKELLELIESDKNPSNLLEYKDIHDQIVSTLIYDNGKYRCEVVDHANEILYAFSVNSTPVPEVFSISLRFLKNNYHLLRLDFGKSLRHINNFGKENEYIVHGSHAHFYSSPSKHDIKNVVPIADISEFKNLNTIAEVFLEYIKYTNIVEKR